MSRSIVAEREGVPVAGTAICELCESTVNYRVWFPGGQVVRDEEYVAAMDYFLMLHRRLCDG